MQETKKMKILLVDDEADFRATAATLFRKRGYDVKTATSGKEAVEALKEGEIDVVILDVKMPEMDGLEALYKMRRIQPNVEVIMLTGHGSPNSALTGLRGGAFAYITKPCDIDLLSLKIREAFLKKKGLLKTERRIRDVMIPVTSFGSVRDDWSVGESIEIILGHKTIVTATVEEEPIEIVIGNRTIITTTVDEGVHRCVLVRDKDQKIIGIVSFTDFLQGLESTYLRVLAERPDFADSIGGDARSFSNIFTEMVRDVGKKSIRELILDTPPSIDANATLLEATNRLLSLNVRRLLVMEDKQVIGVIREKDIMFEMATILRSSTGNIR